MNDGYLQFFRYSLIFTKYNTNQVFKDWRIKMGNLLKHFDGNEQQQFSILSNILLPITLRCTKIAIVSDEASVSIWVNILISQCSNILIVDYFFFFFLLPMFSLNDSKHFHTDNGKEEICKFPLFQTIFEYMKQKFKVQNVQLTWN